MLLFIGVVGVVGGVVVAVVAVVIVVAIVVLAAAVSIVLSLYYCSDRYYGKPPLPWEAPRLCGGPS